MDAEPGYLAAIADGRESWRRCQIAALAREAPEIVAQNLAEEHSYRIAPPEGGHHPARRTDTLRLV